MEIHVMLEIVGIPVPSVRDPMDVARSMAQRLCEVLSVGQFELTFRYNKNENVFEIFSRQTNQICGRVSVTPSARVQNS